MDPPPSDSRLRPTSARRVGGLCFFEFEPETTAFARLGLDADFTIHALDGFADKGEANTGAFIALVELLEHVEDTLLILCRDANAVVFKPETDPSGPGRIGG